MCKDTHNHVLHIATCTVLNHAHYQIVLAPKSIISQIFRSLISAIKLHSKYHANQKIPKRILLNKIDNTSSKSLKHECDFQYNTKTMTQRYVMHTIVTKQHVSSHFFSQSIYRDVY